MELIGLDMKIVSSSNPSDENICGKILDETFHSLVVLHEGKEKKLFKKNIIFKIHIDGSWQTIRGNQIELRPEDRIKKQKLR